MIGLCDLLSVVTLLYFSSRAKWRGRPTRTRENAFQFNEDRLASIVRRVYTASQADKLATAQRSSSSAHASVEDELRSRFQTPRV